MPGEASVGFVVVLGGECGARGPSVALAHHLLAIAGEDLVRFVEKEIRFRPAEDVREEEIPLVVELPKLSVGELERHCPASACRFAEPRSRSRPTRPRSSPVRSVGNRAPRALIDATTTPGRPFPATDLAASRSASWPHVFPQGEPAKMARIRETIQCALGGRLNLSAWLGNRGPSELLHERHHREQQGSEEIRQ